MIKEDLYRFIGARRLAVLSSIGASSIQKGKPQSALVGIAVTRELEIVFDTVEESRKCRNLFVNHACSLVIGWEGEETVQYEGLAEHYSVEEEGPWKDAYLAAWPDAPERAAKWPGLVYFVVRPKWIRYSDFRGSVPEIAEFTF
ncbi:MAG TPA: pyridoxamine 5'-phosphate oxidase family protein [Bryobacteraceae bacterium]|nr:pyridoxamine 5'-phosphate oxidase family protein [Bryobacteraceae bacterium]